MSSINLLCQIVILQRSLNQVRVSFKNIQDFVIEILKVKNNTFHARSSIISCNENKNHDLRHCSDLKVTKGAKVSHI